jgi:hypothetical protein
VIALAALLLGCPRPLPDHLRLDVPPASAPASASAAPVTDRTSAVAAVLGADPLGRRAVLLDPARLEGVPGTAPLAALLDAGRRAEAGGTEAIRLAAIERDHPGTEVVALARGLRLGLADGALASTVTADREAQRRALSLVTPLAQGPDDPSNPRGPLDWAGGEDGLLAIAERWVLAGWLDGPEVPVAPAAAALAASPFDTLRGRPLGRLVTARAAAPRADAAAAHADLALATHLSLLRVAADRDTEQGAWADEKRRHAEALGVSDPIRALLERSFEGLLADAGSPRSAGAALVAATALRILDRCPDAPCAGLDRTATLRSAARWDPEVGPIAGAWEIVLFDQTLATLHAGRDTGLFAIATVDLADLLVGSGAPVDAALLAKSRPDPTVWLIAGRGVGEEGLTTWEDARVALGRALRDRATAVAASAAPDDRPLLERIAARAVP